MFLCLFERKSALFALALSEVMIVKVSVNDIGRYQASGLPLLKTSFEVNFQLFQTVREIMRQYRLFIGLETRSPFFKTHSQIQRTGRTCKKSSGCGRRALRLPQRGQRPEKRHRKKSGTSRTDIYTMALHDTQRIYDEYDHSRKLTNVPYLIQF
jgi:hypothetical protein